MQKITKNSAPNAPKCSIGANGARHTAPNAPKAYRHGAWSTENGSKRCKKLRDAKNCKKGQFGESHTGAVISDADVDLMRELHEEFPRGHPKHMGYRKITEKFNLRSHGGHVARILRYEARVRRLYLD